MPEYSQQNQPIRVDTVLDEDVLLLAGFRGEEEVSKPFVFELELLSEDPNLNPDDLLRTPVSIGMLLPDGEIRRIHGKVRSFGFEGQRGELNYYRAEMVPWLWFLSLTRECRIFQHKSVPDIIEEIFDEYDGAQFRTRFAQDYPEREFCVQYRETNLDFVCRLLEEEGIFYFFEHTEEGHTLILTDYARMQPFAGQEQVRMYSGSVPQEDVVRALTQRQAVHTGTISLADYDQMKPSLELRSSMAGEEPDEIYEYQKHLFTELDEGERYARIGLEREEATRHVVRGEGTVRGFQAGHRFELTNHDRRNANGEYGLLRVEHVARSGAYIAGSGTGDLDYENRFVAIPHGTPYRPALRTPKPTMPGSQTALVVGPAGEDINVDEHGRVQVQFHWDRLGAKDENSSCWVRVSQNWAGKRWGGMFIPHVGHEVIVDFLEGDPDRPIITGRVYNAENTPPQDLPANKHKSIIEDHYGNEMVFDATPGDEHIRIFSPSHRSLLEIGKSCKCRSDSDYCEIMDGDKAEMTFGNLIGLSIGVSSSVDIGGSFKVSAGYNFEFTVAESMKIEFGPTLKLGKADEFKWGMSKFSNHVQKEARLQSDKEVLLIGGSGSESSLLEGNSKAMTLQYAPHRPGLKAKDQAAMAKAVMYTTIGGLVGNAVSTAAADAIFKTDDDDDASYGALLGMIPTALVDTAVLADQFKKLSKGKAGDIDRAKIHGAPSAQLKLDKDGVDLVGASPSKGSAPVDWKARLLLKHPSGGTARLESKQLCKVRSEKSDVVVQAKKTIKLVGKKVVAQDGPFKTKNIFDAG
jgi:type VI secretion system secreted protein VgrG